MTKIENMIVALKILSKYGDKISFWAEHDKLGTYDLSEKPSDEDCKKLDVLGWFIYPDARSEEDGKTWMTFV